MKIPISLLALVAVIPVGGWAQNAGEHKPSAELKNLNALLYEGGVEPAEVTALAEQLLLRWASMKPAEAMHYALDDAHTHIVFLRAAGNVMEAWARRDPVAARAFFGSLEAMQAELVAPSLLQGYGSQAPESALEWIHAGTLSDGLRAILAQSVVGVYESARRREEIKLWLSLPGVADSPHGALAAGDLARRIARGNPGAALTFCRELPENSAARLQAFQQTARQWATGDLEACREWLAQRPSGGSAEVRTAGNAGLSAAELDHSLVGILSTHPSPEQASAMLGAIRNETLRAKAKQILQLPTPPTP